MAVDIRQNLKYFLQKTFDTIHKCQCRRMLVLSRNFKLSYIKFIISDQ